MIVYLIRHGLTRLSEEHRYQGRLDNGLSETGRAALKSADLFPTRVFVSSAKRARETAEILFPQVEQIVCPGLREMDFGLFEGRGWWEMEADPAYRSWDELIPAYEQEIKDMEGTGYPEIEKKRKEEKKNRYSTEEKQ